MCMWFFFNIKQFLCGVVYFDILARGVPFFGRTPLLLWCVEIQDDQNNQNDSEFFVLVGSGIHHTSHSIDKYKNWERIIAVTDAASFICKKIQN